MLPRCLRPVCVRSQSRQTSQLTQGYSQRRSWVLSIGGNGNVMQSTTQIFGFSCGCIDNRERIWWEEGALHESLKGKLLTFSAGVHFFSDFHSLCRKSAASVHPSLYHLGIYCSTESMCNWLRLWVDLTNWTGLVHPGPLLATLDPTNTLKASLLIRVYF